MTETEIDDGAWAERYVTGRLGESDLALFEAHLVDCPACLDRVDAAARLGAALRRSEHLPSRVASTPPRRTHWARRAASWSAAAVAMALAVGAGVTAQNARRSEAELAARLADAQAQLAVALRDAERAREAPLSPPPVWTPPAQHGSPSWCWWRPAGPSSQCFVSPSRASRSCSRWSGKTLPASPSIGPPCRPAPERPSGKTRLRPARGRRSSWVSIPRCFRLGSTASRWKGRPGGIAGARWAIIGSGRFPPPQCDSAAVGSTPLRHTERSSPCLAPPNTPWFPPLSR